MAGQSINDRLTAARLSIAGQGLAKSVCKATTEEVIGPKKKHLDYLLHCTNEPNVSIPQLANLLIERSSSASWVVVFKALVTVHHLMCYGNERFTQYLASSNCTFQLSNFLDKTGVQVGYDMSTFIRRYAKYLNEKAMSYRIAAFDFCKVKRGSKEDGILRTMNAEKLVKTLPVLQNQVDALLEFDCTANELTNGVINTAFMLLFRDLIRLFACYNDGIINLLEKYFDMNKKMVRDALDIYKKFLIRMDRVAEFLKVAENVGIDKGDIPDLTKAPSSLLDALEQHLATLEGKKGGATTPTQPPSSSAGRQTSVKNAVLALSNTSTAFGTAAASSVGPRQSVNGAGEDDPLKKLALEEEQAILELHKERRLKELAGQSPSSDGSGGIGTNPFLSSPMRGGNNLDTADLFGSPTIDGGQTGVSKASDDLLCLANNPFSSIVSAPGGVSSFWSEQNGGGGSTGSSTFVPESSFTAVFGGSAANQPAVAASHGISISEIGSEKGCDLTIQGLNPFAGISSPTPSPSVPFEFGGLGTTPILGAPESQGFGFGDGGGVAVASVHADESDLFCETDGTGAAPQQFEANFAFGSPKPESKSSSVPRPISPAPGTQAPKPTPASSPAPPSFLSDADVFGSFSFGGNKQQRSSGGAFDLGSGEIQSSPARGATSSSSSFTALDDLNATIRASLGGGGGGGGSSSFTAGVGSSTQPSPPPNPSCTQLPSAKQPFGFGSPSKMASDFDAFGDILQPLPSSGAPLGTAPSGQTKAQSKVITGDLDSSLASLVQNLEINRTSSGLHKSGHVWNSPKNTAKTGGANWTPHVASSTAAGGAWNSPQHTYQPMGSTTGRPADWSSGMMAGHFPQAGVQTFTGSPVVGTSGSQVPIGSVPIGGGATQPSPMLAKGFAASGAVPSQQQQTTLDPFGAL